MSYPVLVSAKDFAHVEVRQGRGASGWATMTQVHSGSATAGQEWKAGEGEKLAARHCLWPSDPDSTLSQPYIVAGTDGLGVGKAERLAFPSHGFFSAPTPAPAPLILHQDPRSGNCYKIALTAALLGIPLEVRDYDIMRGETRTPEFLARVNPNGRIPVLQIRDKLLPESNAACWYLGEGSALIPDDRFDQADVLRWMFFEQYNHEPNVATLRFWLRFIGQDKLSEAQKGQIPLKRAAGDAALRLMDDHLAHRPWLVGESVTLADIALYAYTHVCEEGCFALDDYPAVAGWLARIEALPGFVAMDG